MKLSLHSWSYRGVFAGNPSFTVFDFIDAAAELGFSGVEIMTGKANCPPEHIGGDARAHLQKVRAHADRRGIVIDCLSTYNDFAYVKDEAWRLANIAYIKQWLALAGEIGVSNIRMLTGYYNDLAPREQLEQLTRDGIRECIPHAEAAGVNMAIENHNSIFFTAAEIIDLIRACGSPRLTACPDASNWGGKGFFSGDPAAHATVCEQARLLAPFATHAHLKVKGVTPDGSLIGWNGTLDKLLACYHAAGYRGAMAFECVADGDLIAPLAPARALVAAALARAGMLD